MQNHNMHGRFIPTTPNMNNQFGNSVNTYSNFTESFNRNRPLIDTPDYKNRGELLHNNVGETTHTERVVEYRVQISSEDRDIKQTANPFDIKVSMGNSSNGSPNIRLTFKNIKYITLNSVILPRTTAIDISGIDPDGAGPPPYDIYPTLSPSKLPLPAPPSTLEHNLNTHPYLFLRSKEMESVNNLASNSLLGFDTFMLIPDQNLGDMYMWKPRRTTTVYPNSKYGNATHLSLTILDEFGETLTLYDETGKKLFDTIGKGCTFIGKPLGTAVPENFNEYVEKYSYDHKSVKRTNKVTQVIYDFTFGVIENELNTQPNFN
jgi:hypothetical protein